MTRPWTNEFSREFGPDAGDGSLAFSATVTRDLVVTVTLGAGAPSVVSSGLVVVAERTRVIERTSR